MFSLPTLQIGEPLQQQSLTVFPLFGESATKIDYLLSDEAIEKGFVTVEEISEGGSVPELQVENKGDLRVLFLEGEELIGAKQNRVLNTSVLLPAHTKIKIPVSCVEQGRWSYRSRQFGSAGRNSPSKLRYILKSTVNQNLEAGLGHFSDQGKVWDEVRDQQSKHAVSSPTRAMADTYLANEEKIALTTSQFAYPAGATGMAVAFGNQLAAIDLFDNPETCAKVWNRLLSGMILESFVSPEKQESADPLVVQENLNNLKSMVWEQVKAIGEGEEYRVKSTDGNQASALALGPTLIHGSLLTGVS